VSRVAARCRLRVDAALPADCGELSEHGCRMLSACRTWGEFLSYAVDLQATVKPRLLARLAECCGDAGERGDMLGLGGDHGGAAYDERVASMSLSLADALDAWPSCVPSAAVLLHHAPRMSARYYSVASARELWPEVSIVVAEHVYRARGGARRVGVCSRFLLDDCAGSAREFGAIVRAAGDFSLPLASLVAQPAILVATGTGIAPFLALLAERRSALGAQSASASASPQPQWRLYYGVQTLACALDRDALERAERDGVLDGLHVAVSRERQHAAHPHAYVQELLARDGDALFERLVRNDATIVYVCGGVATAVARSVEDVLLRVLRERAAQLPDGLAPEAVWERVRAERRFRVDVWE
jgi:methionine synthase reductase